MKCPIYEFYGTYLSHTHTPLRMQRAQESIKPDPGIDGIIVVIK